jgi:hypothetical protein
MSEIEHPTIDEDDDEATDDMYTSVPPPRNPSQVYSVRIPVARLETLRQIAREQGIAPSALMREWVLERLSAETGSGRGPATITVFNPEQSIDPDWMTMTMMGLVVSRGLIHCPEGAFHGPAQFATPIKPRGN